jgi:hypothetical protein
LKNCFILINYPFVFDIKVGKFRSQWKVDDIHGRLTFKAHLKSYVSRQIEGHGET